MLFSRELRTAMVSGSQAWPELLPYQSSYISLSFYILPLSFLLQCSKLNWNIRNVLLIYLRMKTKRFWHFYMFFTVFTFILHSILQSDCFTYFPSHFQRLLKIYFRHITVILVAFNILFTIINFSDGQQHGFCVREWKTEVFVLDHDSSSVTVPLLSWYCNQKEMCARKLQIF
jgi:hypothetical protein